MAPPNVATRIDDSRGPDSVTIHQCECYAQIRFASLPQWNNVAKIFASPELSSPWFIIPKASATKLNHVSIYNKPRRSVCTDSIFLNRSGERGEQASNTQKPFLTLPAPNLQTTPLPNKAASLLTQHYASFALIRICRGRNIFQTIAVVVGTHKQPKSRKKKKKSNEK